MLDASKLKVGDVFYGIQERNLAFHRKKIHQEIDGQDWFRYDRPLRTYEVVTYKVLGILRKELEGEWKHDPGAYDLQTEFYVSYQDETHAGRHEMDFYGGEDEYFVDKDAALDYIRILEEKARKMDME